jgi:hypothetical protein
LLTLSRSDELPSGRFLPVIARHVLWSENRHALKVRAQRDANDPDNSARSRATPPDKAPTQLAKLALVFTKPNCPEWNVTRAT